MDGRVWWTPERLRILVEMMPECFNEEIACALGTTRRAVALAINRYRLRRSPRICAALQRRVRIALPGPKNPNWKGGVCPYAKTKRYRERHPERHRAQRAVAAAIKKGVIIRLPCAECGDIRVQAHHDDYTRPLVVTFLCHIHHTNRHAPSV